MMDRSYDKYELATMEGQIEGLTKIHDAAIDMVEELSKSSIEKFSNRHEIGNFLGLAMRAIDLIQECGVMEREDE